METTRKEILNRRLVALFASLMLMLAYVAFGQDVKARSFRAEGDNVYDSKKYFNLAIVIKCAGELEQTDSIQIFIHERDSTKAVMFTVCEKTDLYFAYGRMYLVSIFRKGFSKANLLVNSGVKVKEYGMYIPVNLEKDNYQRSIGIVVWDSRINDVHYYPEPVLFK